LDGLSLNVQRVSVIALLTGVHLVSVTRETRGFGIAHASA
jgi:hypothetical protein